MKLTVEPGVLRAGQKYQLVVQLAADQCATNKTPFRALGAVLAGSASDLDVGTATITSDDACKFTLPVAVKDDALAGKVWLLLQPKPADPPMTPAQPLPTLGEVAVSVQTTKAPPPSPIPTDKPQVDIMWKVLPRQVVADSYGSRVADGFFAVEAVIGNNSGYDLQLAALGFLTPTYKCFVATPTATDVKPTLPWVATGATCAIPAIKDSNIKVETEERPGMVYFRPPSSETVQTTGEPPFPVDAYPMVRGTVEREQSVGTRAIVVNIIKGAGPVLVGAGGYYFGAGSNFNIATELFTAPFEKGLELVWPDLTTTHLINLDNRTLRDGATISNNTSVRINAFISRELVQCRPGRRWFTIGSGRSSVGNWTCEADDARLAYARNFDPADAKERLGKLMLIGQSIQYINRVRIIADADSHQTPAGPIILETSGAVQTGMAPFSVTLHGANLEKANVLSTDPLVTITDVVPSADGLSVTFKMGTVQVLAKEVMQVLVQTQIGVQRVTYEVNQSVPAPAGSPAPVVVTPPVAPGI